MTTMTRDEKIEKMIDSQIDDCKPNDLRETIVELLTDGCKGFSKMTDKEVDEEYESYGFEEEDEWEEDET